MWIILNSLSHSWKDERKRLRERLSDLTYNNIIINDENIDIYEYISIYGYIDI